MGEFLSSISRLLAGKEPVKQSTAGKEYHFDKHTVAGPPPATPIDIVKPQTYSVTSFIKPGEKFTTPDGVEHVAISSEDILSAVNAVPHDPSPLKRRT